jgi:hypothetical protein
MDPMGAVSAGLGLPIFSHFLTMALAQAWATRKDPTSCVDEFSFVLPQIWVRLTLTLKVEARFLSDVVRKDSSVTTPAALMLCPGISHYISNTAHRKPT